MEGLIFGILRYVGLLLFLCSAGSVNIKKYYW